MWGATGGSGGISANNMSGGTGAGGYLEKYLTGLTAGNTLVYTQGSAGSAGASAGGVGGNATVTTLVSGTQTIGTLTCNGSNGSPGNLISATVGGTAAGGDFNIQGQTGSNGVGGGSPLIGAGGATFFSRGADGVQSTSAIPGNPGNPGGLKITWYA
jgi:hypothetical protein